MSKNTSRLIVFTGGGSAGHVTPNLAIIEACINSGDRVAYIGSYHGLERQLVERLAIDYYPIRSGKLRRYFSWQNFIDPFNIAIAVVQSFYYLLRLKPKKVFSKGGFVAFPVVVAARMLGIEVIAHESDFSPGLANRMSYPFVAKLCLTFPEAVQYFKKRQKLLVTGTPIRQQLTQGDKQRGLALCNFNEQKPVVLVTGGGLGATPINQAVRAALDELLAQFNVIHLTGLDRTDERLRDVPGYCQFDYVHDELADLFAASDVIVSRAGANAIYEFILLQKPHLLIPLPKKVSRGDQLDNADYFASKQLSEVLFEEQLTTELLLASINHLYQHKSAYQEKMAQFVSKNPTEQIVDLLHGKGLSGQEQCDQQNA